MRIQHNIMAMNAYRNYNNNVGMLSKNLEKLSSGYRINRAGDDAAGLAISEKMRAQITGLDAAQKNVKDGISLVKTAEGAMQEVQDMLNRMVYLATQSANGTYDNEVDRANLQKEVDSLRSEIDRIADSANFNGIKLLDGSLAAIGENSAVTSVTTADYAAAGVNDTFAATYVTNRPAAATSQTNAVFEVSLDDLAISAGTAGTHSVTLTVGDAQLTFTSADETAQTAENIRDGLLKAGRTGADGADVGTTIEVGELGTADGSANAKYVAIDGNVYEMSVGTGVNSIKFTQVNSTGNAGEIVNPDYKVSVAMTAATNGTATGTVNDRVQITTQGVGVGSSHQAQVDVSLDFSKLKDGDKLTVGSKTYTFKVGESSSTTAGPGETLVDLSTILKTDADLSDAAKQAEAMVKVTETMKDNVEWSVGNGGVSGNVGTLTFQSKSGYTDGTNQIHGTTTDAKMDTESNVMAQFVSKGSGNDASVSVDFDVTKLKAGDIMTINGTTFEFTDGPRTSDAAYTAIDLSAYNIKDGIAAYENDNVMSAIQTAVNGIFASDYTVTTDGSKLTLTSLDDAATSAVFENRTAATVSFGGGSGLTLQIGDTSDEWNQLSVSVEDMHVAALGIGDIDITSQEGAQAAVDKIKAAINSVSMTRGTLGATQNRLEHTANNLAVMEENITDAESTIRDTDVADEMMAYTKNNILIQSAQAMLAQANAVPQGVLQLLQ